MATIAPSFERRSRRRRSPESLRETAGLLGAGTGGIADGKLTLSLRPQHVQLLASAPSAAAGALVVTGRVTDAAYLGGNWEYTLDLGMGTPVLALSHATPAFERGQAIHALIDPARIAVIDDH